MPNINDFFQSCKLLGIDHIEILPDRDGDGGIITDYNQVIKRTWINESTYEYHRLRLERSNIVFFNNGTSIGGGGPTLILKAQLIDEIIKGMTNEEVIAYFQQLKNGTLELEEDENGYVTIPVSNDMFVQNAILYSDQAAGPEETWAYQTSTVEIPMETGIRTFSGATKDEIVTQGLMGIIANNLNNKDANNNYAVNSLFGKIKRKVEKAMTDKYGPQPEDWKLEDVKLPWLYNRIGIYPNSAWCDLAQGTYYSTGYEDPAWNSGIQTQEKFATAIDLTLQSYSVSENQYIYTIYFNSTYTNQITRQDLASPSITWGKHFPLYWCKNSANGWARSTFGSASNWYSFHGVVSFGGYEGANECMASPTSDFADAAGSWNARYRTIRYSEQPYLIGFVLWITDIVPSGTYKYCKFWLVPIAFNEHGDILQPLFDNQPVNLNEEVYNGITFNNKQASPIPNLNGNIIIRMSLPLSQAEADYALANNFVIVPVSCLPNDTTYVENGEEPGSET